MKYLLISDNKRFRTFLRHFITTDKDGFLELDEGRDIIFVYGQFKPDFVLMDMNKALCFKIIEQIKQYFPESRIIAISDYTGGKYRDKALRAGADGLVPKDNLLELLSFL